MASNTDDLPDPFVPAMTTIDERPSRVAFRIPRKFEIDKLAMRIVLPVLPRP